MQFTERVVKLAFHDADTDTDRDILARMSARMSVSASWNASLILRHTYTHHEEDSYLL